MSSYRAYCKSFGIFNKYTTMAAFEGEECFPAIKLASGPPRGKGPT